MLFRSSRTTVAVLALIWSAVSTAKAQLPAVVSPDSLTKSFPSPSDSVEANLPPKKHCVIQISSLIVDDMKLDDTLDLTIDANGIEIGGCVFKLAVANNIVDIVDILPGELIDSCRWDMFDAHRITTNYEAAPREVWQITTLAQGMSGKKKPLCFGFDRPAVLARLVVSSAHRPSVADTTAEIFFYWESCRDNILSSREGASVLISDTVSDVLPAIYTTERGTFPTRYGSPANCVSPRAKYPPRRLVNFRNGGVTFRVDLEQDSLSARTSTGTPRK